jgi:hypothetical protein
MCIPVSSEFSSTSKYLTHTPLSFIVSSALIQAHHTHTHHQRNDEIKRRLYQLSKQFPADPATFLYIWRECKDRISSHLLFKSDRRLSVSRLTRSTVGLLWRRSKCLVQPPDFLALTPKYYFFFKATRAIVTKLRFVT